MSEAQEDLLAALLLRWEEASDRGEDLRPAALCAECPELVDHLKSRIEALKKMAWMTAGSGSALIALPDPILGQTLAGRYRIEHLIAEGGFGRVYRAYDPELQRHVAIKVARTNSRPEQVESLLEEARRVAKLRHPGIVAIHDVGRHDGQVFFVTELIEGQSLAERIARSRLNPLEAIRIIAEVGDALQFAHDQGFIHRDVKPANILLDQGGRPHLADFGIAASLEEITTGDASSSGTLAYMAPEQLAGEPSLIGPPTDIFALGIVLYELLSEVHPFSAESPVDRRNQILLSQPPPLRSVAPAIPSDLEAVCRRCLAKHPKERFQRASDLAAALRNLPRGRSRPKALLGAALIGGVVVAGLFASGRLFPNPDGASESPSSPTSVPPTTTSEFIEFDGKSQIVTPVASRRPITVEAWIRPRRAQQIAFFIGSDGDEGHGRTLGTMNGLLVAKTELGTLASKETVPLQEWSHVAAVFGTETNRLFFNGQQVAQGRVLTAAEFGPKVLKFSNGKVELSPATRTKSKPTDDTAFVIGGAGPGAIRFAFEGQIRGVRISRGERFSSAFMPEERFAADHSESPAPAILIFGSSAEANRIRDLSGAGNDGIVKKDSLVSPH